MDICVGGAGQVQWGKEEPQIGPDCDKCIQHSNRPSLSSNDVVMQTQKMGDLVKQILQQNSPKTTKRDRLELIRGLKYIPREKRKDVVMALTKNLHSISKHGGMTSLLNNEAQPT
jgi:putative ubiquitin-RnfH superfamily antitoxin RatB of RatAB toxin-antitoxin module